MVQIKDDKMVWNGNFEKKPIQNGFGWIIEKLDNVYIGYDWEEKSEGNYSLYIEFNGKENMRFKHVSKIVPVVPDNEYSFSYFIKTDDLTTRNGVYWNIYCYPNLRLFNIRSQVFTGSNGWKEYQEEISVPDDCNALIFILSREKSNKLDKFISGKVWIDDVELDISKNEIN